jgi:hypothetical protein
LLQFVDSAGAMALEMARDPKIIAKFSQSEICEAHAKEIHFQR